MEKITAADFFENLPEFNKYFTGNDDKRSAFNRWLSITVQLNSFAFIANNFPGPDSEGAADPRKYLQSLLIAHFALLSWLPLNGLSPAIIQGDQASQSSGEGRISVSYSRISYSEFLSDPYLGMTAYGAQYAYYLRNAQVCMLVL